MTSPLHMVSVPVNLTALASSARNRAWIVRRNAKGREADVGYDEGRALHHLTGETFGPHALQPFRLMVAAGARSASLYAYSSMAKNDLIGAAHDTGPPEASEIFALGSLASKPMPEFWAADRRLGFDLRVRPTVRLWTEMPNPRGGKAYSVGAELDAFMVEAIRQHPEGRPVISDGETTPSAMLAAGRTREAVYRDWLAARLGAAATLVADTVKLTSFARTRVARDIPLDAPPGRGHNGHEGPDATLQGELTVADPAAFAALLAGGVGRHKAYGFGMLLLRPVRRPAHGG